MNDKIQIAIETIALNAGLNDYSIETSSILKGNGFLGVITPLKIIGRNGNETINCIIKSAPNSQALRKKMPVKDSFRTEIHMYGTVFPILELLEKNKLKTSSKFGPTLYDSISDDLYETLIFEDLNVLGYKLHPLGCTVDGDHVRIVMETYGRFHATSFALRDQQLEKFREITSQMKNTYLPCIASFELSLINMFQKSLLTLDVVEDSEAIKKYTTFVRNFKLLFEEVMTISTDKYCVIIHGDAWTNNMMFNYEDEKPKSVRFLDFQMSRLDYPMMDLANFIYTSASMDVLDSLDFYLNLYYESFSNHLRELGGDPETAYPYSVLKKHWQKYARIYLLLTPIILGMNTKDNSKRPDLESIAKSESNIGDAFSSDISEIGIFNDTIRHVILHFVNNNFL